MEASDDDFQQQASVPLFSNCQDLKMAVPHRAEQRRDADHIKRAPLSKVTILVKGKVRSPVSKSRSLSVVAVY